MAKKKQALSSEELLAEALVREEDWPYAVPGNWVWTRLNYIAEYKKGPFGSAVTKAMFVPKSPNTYKVYEQGVAIRKNINYGTYYISAEKYSELKGFRVAPGDLIVSCAGTVGETYQLPDGIEPGIINQALMRVKVKAEVNLKYFLMYFDEILREDITGNSKGTAIKNIPPFSVLKMMPYPLPPLAEQQRIVDRIESLFDQLDQAKELIQAALDSFATRKAAILHQAFTGQLTKKWRAAHGLGLESWSQTTLIEQTTLIGDGLHDTPIYNDEGEYFFINGNNLSGTNILIKPETKRVDSTEHAKYKKELNDKTVLVSINGTLGKTGFYNNEPVILGKSACYFNVKNSLDKLFIRYYLETKDFINYANIMATGSTIKNLSLKSMRNLPINLPSLPEQLEIVRILDDLLAKEQHAKDLCELIDQIEAIKKTILSQAFRGELGTNQAGEASALELLQQVLSPPGQVN